MKLALLRYTVLRLAVFVASLLLLALGGARGILLLVLATAVSAALSYLLLRGPRSALSAALEDRTRRRLEARAARPATGLRADEAAEDAEADASQSQGEG